METKYAELQAKTEQLMVRYQKLLKELSEIQVELRKIRHEMDQIAKENPIFGSFAFLALSLNANYLEKLNNLDISNDKERVTRTLELLSKNQKKGGE